MIFARGSDDDVDEDGGGDENEGRDGNDAMAMELVALMDKMMMIVLTVT